MRITTLALFALSFALPAQAGEYGPLRSTTNENVVGMILTANAYDDDDLVYVRATASIINPDHASTAWIFCSRDGMSLGPPDRLDGNIGLRTLEGFIDVESFCPDGNEVRIVIVDHDVPVNDTLNGVEGSIIQVTTNNVTDPFCTELGLTTCEVIATGRAPLPGGDDD